MLEMSRPYLGPKLSVLLLLNVYLEALIGVGIMLYTQCTNSRMVFCSSYPFLTSCHVYFGVIECGKRYTCSSPDNSTNDIHVVINDNRFFTNADTRPKNSCKTSMRSTKTWTKGPISCKWS